MLPEATGPSSASESSSKLSATDAACVAGTSGSSPLIGFKPGDPFDDFAQLFTQFIQRPVATAFRTVKRAGAVIEDIEMPLSLAELDSLFRTSKQEKLWLKDASEYQRRHLAGH